MEKKNDLTPGRPLRAYNKDGQFSDYSTDDLVSKKLNFFEGWSCGLGTMSLFVDMDGNIFGASCQVGGKLGNIYEDFEIPKKWLICNRQLCSCGADLFIPKAKTEELKNLLAKTNSEEVNLKKRSLVEGDQIAAIERTHASNLKQVYWEIGRRCNYDCSYCWPWIHNKTDRHKTFNELLTATEKVIQKFSQGSRVNFIISGGEPTLNPDFLDWVRYISTMGHYLSMHSNGTRLPEYYRELIHFGDLNLSAHFETINIEKFIKVVAAITDEKAKLKNVGVGHLEVKMMMAPGRRAIALELQEGILKIPNFKNYCTWAFVPIRDGKMGDQIMEGYTDEDFKLFGNGVV
ncbi:MAG: radical SAM protein [Pseudobdellovibrio sp.]